MQQTQTKTKDQLIADLKQEHQDRYNKCEWTEGQVSEHLYICRPVNAPVWTIYVGFNDIKQLITCQQQLESMGLVTEVRKAERLRNFSDEIKIWKPNSRLILALLLRDFLIYGRDAGYTQSIFAKRPRHLANDSVFIDHWIVDAQSTHIGSFLEAGTQYQVEKCQNEGRKVINLVPLSGIILPNQLIQSLV